MGMTFFEYYTGTIIKPFKTFEKLIADTRSIKLSMGAVLITAILYTFVYVFLIFGGGQPFKPWLDIPLEVYYRYNVLFCAPSMFLGWILAAGTVHLVSRLTLTIGSFEKILATFGFGISIASWTTGIHDLLSSFLGAIKVIDQTEYELALNSPSVWRTLLWIQMMAYLIAFVTLFSIAVKTVYKSNMGTAVGLGATGFMIYQLFFLIFNR